MFKPWNRRTEEKPARRMTEAELCRDMARLTTRTRILKYSPLMLPVVAVAVLSCGAMAIVVGVAATGLSPGPALVVVLAGLAGSMAVTAKATEWFMKTADRLQAKYLERLEKNEAETRRRADRSPVLLTMIKATHQAKAEWKRNALSAAAEKAFTDGTEKAVTINRPLKLAPTP